MTMTAEMAVPATIRVGGLAWAFLLSSHRFSIPHVLSLSRLTFFFLLHAPPRRGVLCAQAMRGGDGLGSDESIAVETEVVINSHDSAVARVCGFNPEV